MDQELCAKKEIQLLDNIVTIDLVYDLEKQHRSSVNRYKLLKNQQIQFVFLIFYNIYKWFLIPKYMIVIHNYFKIIQMHIAII